LLNVFAIPWLISNAKKRYNIVGLLFMIYLNIARFAHLAICPFMAQLGGICG
jgi:hypothetical protein